MNLIDLFGLVGGGLLVSGGVSAYRLVNQPVPEVVRIEPAGVRASASAWLTITGTNFRAARAVMVTNVLLPKPIVEGDDRLRVWFDPAALALPAGTYRARVLNGWGRGVALLDGMTVLPPLAGEFAHGLQVLAEGIGRGTTVLSPSAVRATREFRTGLERLLRPQAIIASQSSDLQLRLLMEVVEGRLAPAVEALIAVEAVFRPDACREGLSAMRRALRDAGRESVPVEAVQQINQAISDRVPLLLSGIPPIREPWESGAVWGVIHGWGAASLGGLRAGDAVRDRTGTPVARLSALGPVVSTNPTAFYILEGGVVVQVTSPTETVERAVFGELDREAVRRTEWRDLCGGTGRTRCLSAVGPHPVDVPLVSGDDSRRAARVIEVVAEELPTAEGSVSVAQLPAGSALTGSYGESFGELVERFVRSPGAADEPLRLQVALLARAETGALWVKDADGPDRKRLVRGTVLTSGTAQGPIRFKVLSEIAVQQPSAVGPEGVP